MPYQPFLEKFHDLALKETRSFSIQDESLPADEYGLFESYCNDENCDCRRVFFNVLSRKSKEVVAVIAYGWESAEFYAQWYGKDDPKHIQELQGPTLDLAGSEPKLANAIFEVVRDSILKDSAYVARLKRHYRIFKEEVDPTRFKKADVSVSPVASPTDEKPDETTVAPSPKKKSRKRHHN